MSLVYTIFHIYVRENRLGAIIVYELLSKINRNVCNAFFIHCQSWVNSRHLHTIGLVIIEDSCIPLD